MSENAVVFDFIRHKEFEDLLISIEIEYKC